MSRERKLPAVPAISSKVPREIAQVLGPLKQIVEALQQGGVVAASSNGIGGAGSTLPSTNIPDDVLDKLLDVTIPPAPTGVMVHGGMALIIVEFDRPAYRNHAYTEVWRADSDDFSKAVLIGTTQAFVYSDSVGGGRVAWYWLRHVSSSTPPRFGPFNSQTGTRGETGQDATYVLDLVKGKLQDVHIAQVNAAKVVGTLQDWQLEAINANKIAGQLLDSQLAALNAAKLVGQLQDQQIAQLSVDKLLGKVQFSQLASDVQGPLNSAIYTANQALVKANEAATATSVTQLQARVDAMSTNLLPVDLWKPNGQPLPAPWRNNVNAGIEQTLVSLPGPYGDATTVLKAVAAGGHNDGGWDVDVKIDITKAYRFSVWIKDVSGSAGSAYLGIQGVQQGGVDAPNPYFLVVPKTALTDGVWHLFVGYVYPAGSVHAANAHSAVYEGTTGNVVFLGNDYTWSPQAEWVSPRCYQYYANEGAEQWFAHPRFEVIDGREPSIAELLSGAGLSVARSAITRVSNVEAALPGKANATDVTQLQARVGQAETNVQSALSRVSTVESALPGKASASDVTALSAKVNVRRTYNLRASGNGYDGRYGYNQGLFSIDGAQVSAVSGYNRSYTVVTFTTAGNVSSVKPFDVYGAGEAFGNGGATEMAAHLDSLPAGTLVLVYTADEPRNLRLSGGLPEAMYRCGASPSVFGSSQFQFRSVYALFGKAGSIAGSGQEFYKGGVENDPTAFLSTSFEVINGEFVGIGPGPGTQVAAALDRVNQVEAALPGKASASEVTSLQGRVTNAESNVTAALGRVGSVEAALPGKASVSDVTNLQGRVSNAESNVSSALNRVGAVEAVLPGKASVTDVTNLQGRVTNAESNVTAALGRIGSVEAALPGKANASDLTTLSASIIGQSIAIYVPGDRGIFYPVGVTVANLATGLQTSWHVYRDQVHLDGDWTGTYSAEVTVRVSAWGNAEPEVLRVFQRGGNGNNRWGLGNVAASYYNWHVVLFLRGGMTHNVRCLSHPGAVNVVMPGANTNLVLPQNGETFGAFYENAAPLAQYLNYDWRPNGVLTQGSVQGLPQVVTDVSSQNSRLGTVEASLSGKASATDLTNLTARVSTTETNVNSAIGRVSSVEAALPGKATASDVATLTARVGNAESSISTISQAVATVDGRVSGRYGIAITATLPDGRKKLSGLQAFNDGSVSQFVITADQLLIQPSGSIINLDPNFTDASHWIVDPGPNANPEFAYVTSAAGAVASTCLYARNASGTGTADVWLRSREVFPINPDKVYRLSGRFYSDSGNGRTAYLAILLFDSLGNMLLPGWGGSWSGYPWYGAPSEGSFTEYAGNFGPGTGRSIPSNATQARVGVILNYGAGGENRRMAVQDLRLEEVIPGTLIRPGEITTTHLVAQAVTAEKLAAYSVDVQHLRAGVVTTDKLAAGAVTAVSIKAGEIQTSHFAPLSVTTEKLAAESITAAKLAAQSVTADKLVAQSVTAEKISAGAVTADKLSVGSLSAISANIGTVTAGTLRNAAGSAFVDLNASGSAPFISTSGGFRLNADGSGSIDSRILGNVATGQVVIGVRHYGSYDSGYFEYDTVTIVHGRGRPVLPAMWYVVGNQNMPQLVWNNEYSIGISVSGDSVGFTTVGFAYI